MSFTTKNNCLDASVCAKLVADYVRGVVVQHVNSCSGDPLLVQLPFSNSLRIYQESLEVVRVVTRVLRVMKISFSVVVSALKYFDCFCRAHAHQPMTVAYLLRMLVAALMSAAKFLDDNTFSNDSWAQVTQLPLEEINKFELMFLMGIGFDLHIHVEDYLEWLGVLISSCDTPVPDASPARRSPAVCTPVFTCSPDPATPDGIMRHSAESSLYNGAWSSMAPGAATCDDQASSMEYHLHQRQQPAQLPFAHQQMLQQQHLQMLAAHAQHPQLPPRLHHRPSYVYA